MKCFYTFNCALPALMVLWFEPEVELVILNPDMPVRLDSVELGERVYVMNNAISIEQMQALSQRCDLIWICSDPRLISQTEYILSTLCSTHKLSKVKTTEELTWSWFSEDPLPPTMFISFTKPHFNCLEIAIPRSE